MEKITILEIWGLLGLLNYVMFWRKGIERACKRNKKLEMIYFCNGPGIRMALVFLSLLLGPLALLINVTEKED